MSDLMENHSSAYQNEHPVRDEMSGRLFIANLRKVQDAVSALNHRIFTEGEANLNDLHDELGMSPSHLGSLNGWDQPVELRCSSELLSGGQPGMTFWLSPEAKPVALLRGGR